MWCQSFEDVPLNTKSRCVDEISDLREMRCQQHLKVGPQNTMSTVTASDFRQRAKHYRIAAALTEETRYKQQFCDLAFIFDRIAQEFL
jgi:hypothetical protein